MECVRQIVDSDLLNKIYLPNHLRNRKVEVIIMPADDAGEEKRKPVDGLIGILNKYADPELVSLEKNAWAKAMENKYADR